MGDLNKRGEKIDRITLANELTNRDQLDSVGGLSYLVSLDDGLPQAPNVDAYIRIIKDKAVRRRVIFGADALIKRALLQTEDTGTVITAGKEFFQQAASDHQDEILGWPEPLPIGSELPEVDKFDPLLLPEALRDFVEDIAERMQVPPDYPAACLMVAMAGAVNRRASIQPKAEDSSWLVVPNLWGGIIAPPGFLKSPVLHAITAPLYAQEAVWRAEYDSRPEDYETQKEEMALRLAAWKEQTKAGFKKVRNCAARKKSQPPPCPARYFDSGSRPQETRDL